LKALIQRVSSATVTVEGDVLEAISGGLLVFLGLEKGDSDRDLDYMARKVANLRIFEDDASRMNLSVKDVKGSILLISQFTLAADCRKGNRPSFDNAEDPAKADEMYLKMAEKLRTEGIPTATGKFGAHMTVSLVNDGPVTIMIDSKKLKE
jgi:D-tyrosyl-tRNA(Tyr) deacylase